jgi:hypothetical protein
MGSSHQMQRATTMGLPQGITKLQTMFLTPAMWQMIEESEDYI